MRTTPTPPDDEMPAEIDFTVGTRGKFHRLGATLSLPLEKVGMQEFREHFDNYVDAGKPVAVTKHGRTVGLYIPVRHKPGSADLVALEEAGRALDTLMGQKGISEEAAVEVFERLRLQKTRRG